MPQRADSRGTSRISVKKKTVSGALRILIPLFATYLVFALGIFLIFIPQQRQQLREQKKAGILQLTDSTFSLLAGYDARVRQGDMSLEDAQKAAVDQIRHLRYGPEGKDYFWINDYHPFMVMHPYRSDLEGRDLTEFRDIAGNYPFVAMVDAVMRNGAGYVNYHWQWRDTPETIGAKISYVRGFPAWKWIVGTGIYEADISLEIELITQKFIRIFAGILVFILVLSLYISAQVFRIERKREAAVQARQLDELRLKKLYELSQLTDTRLDTITEFALEEAIKLTKSNIGYLAFMNEDETLLTMHTWSDAAMKGSETKDKGLVYEVSDTGPWARSARTRRPEVINDYPGDTSPDKKGDPRGHLGITRMMNIPVFEDEKIVALAGVGNKRDDYDESDIRQLRLMMDGMWKILRKTRAEARLRESEARYRILADNATDVIWILELDSLRFSYMSPAIQTLLGYPPESFLNSEMGQHVKKESLDRVSALISEELDRDGQPGVDPNRRTFIEMELKNREGKIVWAEITARFLRTPEGRPDRILGISRDITERKNLESRIRQSQKMEALGTLAGGIAHDFNNILSSMIGFTELARLKLSDSPDILEKLDHVLAGGLRAKDLVKHILVFSRKADVRKDRISVGPLLKESLKFLRASIPPNIEIRQALSGADCQIMADPTQMHQVLMNLFTNAAHAMKDTGGVLDVHLETVRIRENEVRQTKGLRPGSYLKLVIGDTGCGISKDHLPKIFEPFFTTKPRGEGTGMGLAMVYGIVKEMNGHISAYSEPGMGTTFQLLLPEQTGTPAIAPPESNSPLITGSGNILLVDDESANIKWTSQLLRKLGYDVSEFDNSRKALGAFSQTPDYFDLVLTDLAMPDMTGIELSDAVRQTRPDIPIILITGFSEGLTEDRLREHGICDMVMKPMIAGELARAVSAALSAPKKENLI